MATHMVRVNSMRYQATNDHEYLVLQVVVEIVQLVRCTLCYYCLSCLGLLAKIIHMSRWPIQRTPTL